MKTWEDFVKTSVSKEDELVNRINGAIAETIPFTMKWEKYRPKAYWDNIGKRWTVGHGHTRIPDAKTGALRAVVEGDVMSEKDSKSLSSRIMRENAYNLYKNIPWFRLLSQNAMSAVLDKSYGAGWGVFTPQKSKNLNTKMNVPGVDPDKAYWSEHDTYTSGGGKKNVPGLVNRQKASKARWNNQ